MKAGEYVRFAVYRDADVPSLFQKTGESSTEQFAKTDGARDVEKPGGADVVYVCKIIAVVRRSSRIEE